MFKIGDIVRPKIGFIGHDYCFKVIECEVKPFDYNFYKLQRVEQVLDPAESPINLQLKIIRNVETTFWKEKELELTSDVKLRYDITDINIPDYTSIVLDEMERNLLKLKNKVKEENEMQILDLYEERKRKAIEKEYSKAIKEVKKNDEIQKIIIEMTNQVNTILENQGSNKIYEFQPSLVTLETEIKIDELRDKQHEEIEELRSTLEEIHFTRPSSVAGMM